MELQDKDTVSVTAKGGTYNTKGDKIILRDQVVVTSGQGYAAKMREASVDMKKGSVVSEQPVEITLPNGVLTANRMEVSESGEVIRFDRGVVLTMDAPTTGEAKQ
jgi:lipopolysaccharide export system protein LptC